MEPALTPTLRTGIPWGGTSEDYTVYCATLPTIRGTYLELPLSFNLVPRRIGMLRNFKGTQP